MGVGLRWSLVGALLLCLLGTQSAYAEPRSPDVLLMGFGPFTGFPINPTETLVEDTARRAGWSSAVLTVDPREALEALYPALEGGHRWVIAVGVRAGLERIQVNPTALNWISMRDNHDWLHYGPVDPGLPTEISLPGSEIGQLKRELALRNLDVDVSRDAGTHVCNLVLFHGLLHAPGDVRFRFIHVPPGVLQDPDLLKTFRATVEVLTGLRSGDAP